MIEEKGEKGINKKKKADCVSLCQFIMWHDMTQRGENKEKWRITQNGGLYEIEGKNM